MGMPIMEESAEKDHYTVDDLLYAARTGDMDDLKLAVTSVSVSTQNEQGYTALHMASANGHVEVVRYLLDNGADVNVSNAQNNAPLHWAALNGHVQVVEELLNAGANPVALNCFDRTPLDEALTQGHRAVVDAITRHEATTALAREGTIADE